MNWKGVLSAAAIVALLAAPAHAFNWGIGADLGYSSLRDNANQGESSVFALPLGTPFPGIRLSLTGERPEHELHVDLGAAFTDDHFDIPEAHFRTKVVTATGNYQYNFGGSGSLAPYLSAGAGVNWIRQELEAEDPFPFEDASEDRSFVFGFGAGIAHNMGNGHGRVRLGLRYERFRKFEFNLYSATLGFDLWNRER